MTILFVVLAILVLLMVTIMSGAMRSGHAGRRRDVVGRSRPRLGLALVVLGLLGLVGGQVRALASAPGDLAGGPGDDALVLVPKEGPGTDDRYVVRILTYSGLVRDDPLLLEHLSVVMSPGETVTAEATGTGHLVPGEFEFRLSRMSGGGLQMHVEVEVAQASGRLTSGSSSGLGPDGTLADGLDLGSRAMRGRWSALFPGSTFPAAVVPTTLVVVDRAPSGVTEAPAREVFTRAHDEFASQVRIGIGGGGLGVVTPQRQSTRGIITLFGQLGLFAWGMLALAGIGSALAVPRSGLGLAIFLLLAPILIAGLDRYALSRHRAALGHENVRVRASAMVGLQGSILYATTGQGEVATMASKGGEPDAEIAARVRKMMPRRNWRKVRKLIGDAEQPRFR